MSLVCAVALVVGIIFLMLFVQGLLVAFWARKAGNDHRRAPEEAAFWEAVNPPCEPVTLRAVAAERTLVGVTMKGRTRWFLVPAVYDAVIALPNGDTIEARRPVEIVEVE